MPDGDHRRRAALLERARAADPDERRAVVRGFAAAFVRRDDDAVAVVRLERATVAARAGAVRRAVAVR
jgi:hypothetical protein